MIESNSLRWTFAVALAALAAVGCGSSPESSGGAVPEIANAPIAASDFSCVQTRAADSTGVSEALAAGCGCASSPVHIAGCAERWSFVDCSNATAACVNAVLDEGGYRSSPTRANTISVGSCSSLAVVYDPCNICRQNGPGNGGSSGGGGGTTIGDYCPRYSH
jgi:hypothetical protein